MAGEARVVRDAAERALRWKASWAHFHPGGPQSEDFTLLEFRTKRMEMVRPCRAACLLPSPPTPHRCRTAAAPPALACRCCRRSARLLNPTRSGPPPARTVAELLPRRDRDACYRADRSANRQLGPSRTAVVVATITTCTRGCVGGVSQVCRMCARFALLH